MADAIALSLKYSDSHGGINGDDICSLTRHKIFIHVTITELEHHINHGLHILTMIVGSSIIIVIKIKGCLDHIKQNQAIYYEIICTDNLFTTRVLFVIDMHTQIFLLLRTTKCFHESTT